VTFSQEARAAIYERARGLCEWCGEDHSGEWGWWEYHHRKLKQMGGSRDPRINHPDNGALAWSSHHNGGPDSIHGNREEAVRRKLIIPSWEEIPAWAPS
jgi:hypothetical protein